MLSIFWQSNPIGGRTVWCQVAHPPNCKHFSAEIISVPHTELKMLELGEEAEEEKELANRHVLSGAFLKAGPPSPERQDSPTVNCGSANWDAPRALRVYELDWVSGGFFSDIRRRPSPPKIFEKSPGAYRGAAEGPGAGLHERFLPPAGVWVRF